MVSPFTSLGRTMNIFLSITIAIVCGEEIASAFVAPLPHSTERAHQCRGPRYVDNSCLRKVPSPGGTALSLFNNIRDGEKVSTNAALAPLVAAVSIFSLILASPAFAVGDGGASMGSNAKITTGGASTLQSGRTIAITRGVNLDRSDFKGQNLKGVAFQQSIVRDADFRNSNLVGASFFDATLDGSDFEGADLTLANVEMAQLNRANLKDAVMREMYISGSTLFEGVKSIENSDWTDSMLRRDQQKYLCNHPTSKGVNPVTGVETRESLMCPD